MPYLFFIISLFCFSSTVLSQANQIYRPCSVWKDAEIDEKHWKNHLYRKLDLDSLALDTIPSGIYIVSAQFIIDKEGCITEAKLINDPGYSFGTRVIKAIYSYDGRCIAGEQNGRKVKAYRKQQVIFVIEDECKETYPVDFIL